MSEVEIIYSLFCCCVAIRDCVECVEVSETDSSINNQSFLNKEETKDDYKSMIDTKHDT